MFQKLLILCLFGFVFSLRKELTPEQLEKLSSWKNGNKHMWMESGQIEGDMVFRPEQKNGLIDTQYRWENNEIPYEIDDAFSDDEKSIIHEAVKEFASFSCVTVRPKTDADVNYVYVTGEDTGCWSWVGRLGGQQQLNLQRNGCLWHNTIVHEFLHAAGFYHEQSSTERDDYIRIVWENIIAGMEHNFDKYDADVITNFEQPYDLFSIMHYAETAFSSNGEATIVPLNENFIGLVGKAEIMSPIDIIKLRLMYNCGLSRKNK
ncbi:zinc metalloproteinase nas-6-like [Onthophagus taurus]|uniref:zinc metalloproteinase nas-6-like n=1 Tax=Onthophagus taurus TaxID=166361 RepID=UPI0039BE6BCE